MGTSGVSIKWISDLWEKLLALCPLPVGKSKLTAIPRQVKWNVSKIDENKENHSDLKPNNVDMYDRCTDAVFDKPFVATVIVSYALKQLYQRIHTNSFATG